MTMTSSLDHAHRTFGLTEEQVMMQSSVLELLARHMPREKIPEMDETRSFPEEAYGALARAGWLGLPHDASHGGAGGSFKDLAVLVEAISYHNAQMASAYLTTVVYAGMHVRYGANTALKAEILPKVIDGEIRLAFALTEPDAGSDAGSIRTRAMRDGDDYLINGQKMYITCAHIADYLVVVTKTNPEKGHRGISIFLVEADAPGVTMTPLKGLGRRMIHTNQVFFDNVRVPASRMLGDLDGGWKNMMRGLNIERLCLAAAATGNCQRIVDYAADYARQRVQFGRPITQFQAIEHKFADMQMMTEASRVLTYRVADMLDSGLTPNMETAIAKATATENNCLCADIGIQVMGGAGLMMDHEMQMYFRDARVGTIGGGTSEIMRTVVAKYMKLV
jgi:acyl-CoA dehydrogenase